MKIFFPHPIEQNSYALETSELCKKNAKKLLNREKNFYFLFYQAKKLFRVKDTQYSLCQIVRLFCSNSFMIFFSTILH